MNAFIRIVASAVVVLNLSTAQLAHSAVIQTETASSSSSEAFNDTFRTVRVDTYMTHLLAILDGTVTVFDQTFSFQFSDFQVQSALGAAQAALVAAALPNGVIVTGPNESNTQTALVNSIFNTTIDQSILTQTVTLEDTIGPGTIIIGNRDLGGVAFEVLAGTSNLNINTHTLTDIFRTITTTESFLTSSTWTFFGQSEKTGGNTVPEPSSLALVLAALGGMTWATRRRPKSRR